MSPEQVKRIWEQPPDAISFYGEAAQVTGTEHEIVVQFYDVVPNAPGPSGRVETVRSRLRATVVMTYPHALNLGRLLLEGVERKESGHADVSR